MRRYGEPRAIAAGTTARHCPPCKCKAIVSSVHGRDASIRSTLFDTATRPACTNTQKHRGRERRTDVVAYGHTHTHTQTYTDTHTHTDTHRHRHTDTDRQTDTHTDTQGAHDTVVQAAHCSHSPRWRPNAQGRVACVQAQHLFETPRAPADACAATPAGQHLSCGRCRLLLPHRQAQQPLPHSCHYGSPHHHNHHRHDHCHHHHRQGHAADPCRLPR